MYQPITRIEHGFTDYSYIPLVAAAPSLVGFEEEKTATTLCRVASGAILATSLLTRAEWGAFKVVPYKTHLLLDVAVGLFSLSAPWLFGFAHNAKARNTFLAMAAMSIASGTLSKPEEMPAYKL